MTEHKAPAPPSGATTTDPAPTQPFVWLPIVGFLAITAAIIAAAYYFLM